MRVIQRDTKASGIQLLYQPVDEGSVEKWGRYRSLGNAQLNIEWLWEVTAEGHTALHVREHGSDHAVHTTAHAEGPETVPEARSPDTVVSLLYIDQRHEGGKATLRALRCQLTHSEQLVCGASLGAKAALLVMQERLVRGIGPLRPPVEPLVGDSLKRLGKAGEESDRAVVGEEFPGTSSLEYRDDVAAAPLRGPGFSCPNKLEEEVDGRVEIVPSPGKQLVGDAIDATGLVVLQVLKDVGDFL
jgi:hypothetical protein